MPSWQGNNKSCQESANSSAKLCLRRGTPTIFHPNPWNFLYALGKKLFSSNFCAICWAKMLFTSPTFFGKLFDALRLCFNCNICLQGLRVSLCYLFTIHFAALEKLHMLHPHFGIYFFLLYFLRIFSRCPCFLYILLEFLCVLWGGR